MTVVSPSVALLGYDDPVIIFKSYYLSHAYHLYTNSILNLFPLICFSSMPSQQVQGVQWYYAQFIPEAIRASLHYVDQLKGKL